MVILVVLVMLPLASHAAIQGITGPTFNLTAKSGHISTGEGGSYLMWGYANGAGAMQFPGPTLIVNQGDVVTVNLSNELTVPVSIVFPGQTAVAAAGGTLGLLTREAPAAGGTVSYTFTAVQPGTYTYYSGTNPDLQVEMGLVGALIVRPSSNPATQAYNHADSQFDHEYLFLISEMDPIIHDLVAAGNMDLVDNTTYWPVYWFLNGRTAPDTMSENNVPWLPNQPYNCMPMMHPGEKILLRIIGAGRDLHPYHTHGNHHRVIARDGRLLSSAPGAGADLGELAFTTTTVPGQTADAIFTWTGDKLGWDMYGHQQDIDNAPPGFSTGGAPGSEDVDHNGNGVFDSVPPQAGEYAADHGKPFPVSLPSQLDVTNGQFYSGSPFLGTLGSLPPGEGGFNPNGGYMFMWHSHSEKEIVNNDIFPGGMLTMMIIEAPGVTLMNP
jgi:FtsP/CotA-like multicopper oxidase with cupredoxin domain